MVKNQPEGRLSGKTVLIVDDQEAARLVYERLFFNEGATVMVAPDAHEALRRARLRMPDFVFCDVFMGAFGGFEFAKQLRTDPRFAETGVYLYSAIFDPGAPQVTAAANAAGVARVFPRPRNLGDFIDLALDGLNHVPVPPDPSSDAVDFSAKKSEAYQGEAKSRLAGLNDRLESARNLHA